MARWRQQQFSETRMIRIALLATTILLATPALAQRVPAVPVETLKDVTRTLSSDAYAGRAPTSPEEAKTIAYIAQRMAKAGLKPGNAGKWYQDVPMAEIDAKPTPLSFAIAGKPALTLDYKTDMVIGTSRIVPRIEVKDSDVVFVGYGINAPQLGWNDYAGVDVKGKTVVILINDPDWETPTLDGAFGGRAMTYYGRWTYKYEEAARQGAAAAIIVHDTEPAAYPWDVVVSSWAKPRLGLDAADNHMGDSAAIGWMTGDAATRLFASTGKDFAALRQAAKVKGFAAVPLGATMSMSMDNSIRRQMSKNVIGILPGKRAPKQYVLYSAHWDHLGRCLPVKGDGICNGAVDNASGTAALIALAEMNAKAGAASRSQIFLAVTAEESGLLGSKYYAENPVYPLAQTVGGVNMDGLNVLGATKDVNIIGVGKSELDGYVTRWAAKGGRTITPEATPEKGFYYRSDHFSFARLGVPMLDAGSGDDLVKGGVAAGRAAADDYTVNRYHKPQDEYDASWNWDGAVQDLTMYYGIGRELAMGSVWPNWAPNAEFRAIRDKSRAGK
jgi:Zn-dependent M28 family amino/carboxypeptidase